MNRRVACLVVVALVLTVAAALWSWGQQGREDATIEDLYRLLTTEDGRATIMMPHPERAFRMVQLSYKPPQWQDEDGPWMRMFRNARCFVG